MSGPMGIERSAQVETLASRQYYRPQDTVGCAIEADVS